jgi:hypothetical protein
MVAKKEYTSELGKAKEAFKCTLCDGPSSAGWKCGRVQDGSGNRYHAACATHVVVYMNENQSSEQDAINGILRRWRGQTSTSKSTLPVF